MLKIFLDQYQKQISLNNCLTNLGRDTRRGLIACEDTAALEKRGGDWLLPKSLAVATDGKISYTPLEMEKISCIFAQIAKYHIITTGGKFLTFLTSGIMSYLSQMKKSLFRVNISQSVQEENGIKPRIQSNFFGIELIKGLGCFPVQFVFWTPV